MHISVKTSKKGRALVVFDRLGESFVCTDAEDLWESLDDFDDGAELGEPVPGTTALRLVEKRNCVIVYEDGEPTVCTSPVELWGCFLEAAAAAPISSVPAVIAPARARVAVNREPTVDLFEPNIVDDDELEEDDGSFTPDGEHIDGDIVREEDSLLEGVMSAIVGDDTLGRLGMRAIRQGRRLSYRGKTPKRKRQQTVQKKEKSTGGRLRRRGAAKGY